MSSHFPDNPKKILIRSTNWIGDAVMTTPAVRSIRKNFPNSEISILVLPWVSDIFKYSPHVDKLIYYDKKGNHRGLKGKWRLGRELGKENFDCAILLQNAFEAAFLATVAQIPVRGGYTTDGRGLLLTHKIKKNAAIHLKHQVYYYLEMVAGLGIQTTESNKIEIFIPDNLQQDSQKRLQQETNGAISSAPLIGINPGAAYGPAKKWPVAKYAALAKKAFDELGAVIAVFGTSADANAAKHIRETLPNDAIMCDFTGRTTLMEAISLIKQCNVFVTNDSGLMHVAAALNVPLSAIFGSTDHIATGPFSDNSLIIRKEIYCSPCKKPECPEKHLQCLTGIKVHDVFLQVQQLLN